MKQKTFVHVINNKENGIGERLDYVSDLDFEERINEEIAKWENFKEDPEEFYDLKIIQNDKEMIAFIIMRSWRIN